MLALSVLGLSADYFPISDGGTTKPYFSKIILEK